MYLRTTYLLAAASRIYTTLACAARLCISSSTRETVNCSAVRRLTEQNRTTSLLLVEFLFRAKLYTQQNDLGLL